MAGQSAKAGRRELRRGRLDGACACPRWRLSALREQQQPLRPGPGPRRSLPPRAQLPEGRAGSFQRSLERARASGPVARAGDGRPLARGGARPGRGKRPGGVLGSGVALTPGAALDPQGGRGLGGCRPEAFRGLGWAGLAWAGLAAAAAASGAARRCPRAARRQPPRAAPAGGKKKKKRLLRAVQQPSLQSQTSAS